MERNQSDLSPIDENVQILLDQFARRVSIGETQLLHLAKTHFSEISQILEKAIASRSDAEFCASSLSVLCKRGRDLSERLELIRLLFLAQGNQLLQSDGFRIAVESSLYKVDSPQECTQLMKLIYEVALTTPSVIANLTYFATDPLRNNTYKNLLQDQILQFLVNRKISNDDKLLLISRLSEHSRRPDALDWIIKAGKDINALQFHYELVRGAVVNREFSAALLVALKDQATLTPFGPTEQFLRRVVDGCDMERAALLTCMEFRDQLQ